MSREVSVTNLDGTPFTVRLVLAGDKYGLNDCVTHKENDPLIEFYDQHHMHTPRGQFVSRYYLSTMVREQRKFGLCLDGGVPSWQIDYASLKWASERLSKFLSRKSSMSITIFRRLRRETLLSKSRKASTQGNSIAAAAASGSKRPVSQMLERL